MLPIINVVGLDTLVSGYVDCQKCDIHNVIQIVVNLFESIHHINVIIPPQMQTKNSINSNKIRNIFIKYTFTLLSRQNLNLF